ncbi:hypothetical protein HaLaN_19932 [Haematococcus lacustris]|uniref:Uncharacterized protein n=1 Tax=Haematococcus lacustris TaxID=44745 RepID=A0A699ZJH9_HAELA|nr:hypothetical protein HaLaN_19932 [Haematococcus lacustris]
MGRPFEGLSAVYLSGNCRLGLDFPQCTVALDPVGQDPVVWCQDPVVPEPCGVVPGPCGPGPCGVVPGPCGCDAGPFATGSTVAHDLRAETRYVGCYDFEEYCWKSTGRRGHQFRVVTLICHTRLAHCLRLPVGRARADADTSLGCRLLPQCLPYTRQSHSHSSRPGRWQSHPSVPVLDLNCTGRLASSCRSLMSLRSHRASLDALGAAMYSASAVDIATVGWRRLDQLIAPPSVWRTP